MQDDLSAPSTQATDGAQKDGKPGLTAIEEPTASPQRTTNTRTASSKSARTRITPRKSATKRSPAKKTSGKKSPAAPSSSAKFPRHSLEKALRVPRAILEQNAGRPCTTAEAAKYLDVSPSGPFTVEISSAKKYGFLESQDGKLALTDRAKRILRPQTDNDEVAALREAVLQAPDISDVYNHYRGESLPDEKFFQNALTDRFKIPADKVVEFRVVFLDSLRKAKLIDESGDRPRLTDVGREGGARASSPANRSPGRSSTPATLTNKTCFVMQPFAPPYGGYYETMFEPAIEKSGLQPIRADAEIFGTGKVMDQVWRGIKSADVLVAELTTKNANVYYELGIAHALGKPVVLIASNESDVPFDLRHIRVIYYDMTDPFWGSKLIDKIADNIRSALEDPEEAIFHVNDVV